MYSEDSPKQSPDLDILTPEKLVTLGEKLVNLDSFEEQKIFLEGVLDDTFGGNSRIWFNDPIFNATSPPNEKDDLADIIPSIDAPIRKKNNTGQYIALAPLLKKNQNLGTISLERETILSDPEISALSQIGRIAGLSLFAVNQTKRQGRQRRQLDLVQSVSAKISQFTDIDCLTKEVTHLVQESFDYYYVAIFLIDEKTDRLRFKSSSSRGTSIRPNFESTTNKGFMLGEHIIGSVAKTGEEIIANDVSLEPRYQIVDSLSETQSEAVFPLKIEDRIFGVFDIQSNQINAFSEEDLIVLRALANNIAIAVETTRLVENINHRADQMSIIAETSRSITYILDLDELLQKIVHLIHERFDYPFVHIYTLDYAQNKIIFQAGCGNLNNTPERSSIVYDLESETGIVPWVVQNAKPRRINHLSEESEFANPLLPESHSGSELAIPLLFAGSVLGVLDIHSLEESAFSVQDQQLMETLADNITIAIRNAMLYRSEKWRRQVAESLRDVAGLLSDNTELADVLQAILGELHKNLPCDFAGIWLWDQERASNPSEEMLRLVACKTSDSLPDNNLEGMSLTPSNWISTALNGETPVIRKPNDIKDPIALLLDLPDDYSAIAAPLFTGDEMLGVLTLMQHTSGRYGSETQSITSAFASYAAVAIENNRLFETSQEQAWVSTILLQVAQATQSQTTIEELVDTIVRLTPLVVGVKGCGLFLRDPDRQTFSLHAIYGIDKLPEKYNMGQAMPVGEAPILQELSLTQMPLFVSSPTEDLNLPEDLAQLMQNNLLVLLPLMAHSEMLGAILLVNQQDLSDQDTINLLNDERLGIIQGITQQTAIAVENIRLMEAKQEEAYVSTVLLQVAQAIVSGSSLNDKLDSIVHIMPILVGIDSSLIYLWNKNEGAFKVTQAYTEDASEEKQLLGSGYQLSDFPMLEAVFKNNRPVVFPFIETTLPPEDWDLVLPDEDLIDPTPILQSRYPTLMGFPLSVKDEVFGVLLAQDKNYASNRERRYELLWGIAQQASLAIQNDILNKEMLDRQRLEREFQLARQIQQTFLPDHMPTMPGWEMDVRWHTARQVGGDFYDYFLLKDGRLAFVIADVSNKGLAASLYMSVTRTLIRASSRETYSTAKTLERVNELLLMNSESGLFVTTFYGILNLENGALTYTNAGHNPPFIIRKETGEVKELKKGGIALGALDNITQPQNRLIIHPGDCLVLYTDGVTEAFNHQNEMYGDPRLIQILKTLSGESAHNVLTILEADLESFRNEAPLSDDTTMLAICRTPLLTDQNRDPGVTNDAIHSAAE